MSVKPWDELQLRFELPELDEVEEDAALRAITPEQARQISEAARTAFSGQQSAEKPGWFEDYMMLIEQGWPWRVAAYIAWASSPKIGREPKWLKDLAEQVLGLTSPRVINSWRRKYPAIETVVSMMQSKDLWDHRADVLETLAKMAAEPDYKNFNDRKLFLEIIGDYTPKSQVQVGKIAKSLEELSDAELAKYAGEEFPCTNEERINELGEPEDVD